METLNSSANLLSPDCYMVTDAYYHIPIHHDQQKYLKVAVQMSPWVAHFQYRALPFGIAIAPRVFTKGGGTRQERVGRLCSILGRLSPDRGNPSGCTKTVWQNLKILDTQGWQLNREKSSLVPSQIRQFLGIIINSKEQKFLLPQPKIEAIEQLVLPLLSDPKTSIRRAMSLLGLLTATIPAVT